MRSIGVNKKFRDSRALKTQPRQWAASAAAQSALIPAFEEKAAAVTAVVRTEPNFGKKRRAQGCVAVGAGDSCACAFFLSSAALAVACCRRSASDFKFGLEVVCTLSGLSEREQAPPQKAHASKITARIVFIEKEYLQVRVGQPLHYIAAQEQATIKRPARRTDLPRGAAVPFRLTEFENVYQCR